MKTTAFIAALIGIVVVTTNAAEDQWPQFRGPQAGVVADDSALPDRWKREMRSGVPGGSTHLKNGYASETPTTDGEPVYVYFGGFGLYAFDFSGMLLWSKDLGTLNNASGSRIPHEP